MKGLKDRQFFIAERSVTTRLFPNRMLLEHVGYMTYEIVGYIENGKLEDGTKPGFFRPFARFHIGSIKKKAELTDFYYNVRPINATETFILYL